SAGFAAGTVGGVPADGFALPNGRIDLVGITLDIYGPGGLEGPKKLVEYGSTLGHGDPNSGTNERVDTAGDTLLPGRALPEGWLVTPHAGDGLSADSVRQIIQQGVNQADVTWAASRLPLGRRTKLVRD